MIARRRRCSTAAPSTFMATFQIPLPKPTSASPAIVGPIPMIEPTATTANPTAKQIDITATVRAAPSLATTIPAERDRDHRTDTAAEQDQTERRWTGLQLITDSGNARGPTGEAETAADEGHTHRALGRLRNRVRRRESSETSVGVFGLLGQRFEHDRITLSGGGGPRRSRSPVVPRFRSLIIP